MAREPHHQLRESTFFFLYMIISIPNNTMFGLAKNCSEAVSLLHRTVFPLHLLSRSSSE